MKTLSFLFPRSRRAAVVLAALALLLPGVGVSSARAAGLPLVFVASTGSDANDGSRAHPKRTLNEALGVTVNGGDVFVLDSAEYGPATIARNVTVTAAPGVAASISVAKGKNGILVEAGAHDVVTLRGLNIKGLDADYDYGAAGILASSVGTLRVEDCHITGFDDGIFMNCTSGGSLVVNGGSADQVRNAILMQPAADGVMETATVSYFEVDGALDSAFYAVSPQDTSGVHLVVSHCVVTNSEIALQEDDNHGSMLMYADDCTLANNTQAISTSGPLISFGNNQLLDNVNNTMFTSTQPLQ